jgi:uncharacterized protein YjbI with pentapeptide repeats
VNAVTRGLGCALLVACWAATGAAQTARRLTRAEVVAALGASGESRRADLSGTDLSGLDLSGLDFRRADLTASRLAGTNFSRAAMFGVGLDRVVATGANFDGAVLDVAVLRGANLTRASLRDASLYATILVGATLDSADLTGARVIGTLVDASLRGAVLARARLGADPGNQPMGVMRTDLTGADLSGADLRGADLRKAVLTRANVAGADVTDADLTGTVLRSLVGRAHHKGLDRARNRDKAIDDEPAAPGSRSSALGSGRGPSAESREPRAESRPLIAVLDVSFYGAKANSIEPGDSGMATISTGRVWKELRAATTIALADSARVAALADSLRQPGIACNTSLACARAVGRAAGADYVALAKVSKLSNLIWYFSGQLVDVADGRILMDDEFELKGVRDDMVPRGATSLARRLVRVAEKQSPGGTPAAPARQR